MRIITLCDSNIEIESNKDILNIKVTYFSYLWDTIKFGTTENPNRHLNIHETDTVYIRNTLKKKGILTNK